MTNKSIITFTLVLIFLSAFTFCKKEKVQMMKVSGFVYSSSTKQPVSGQEVILEAYEIINSKPDAESSAGESVFRKQKTYTDSRGSYSFSITEKQFLPVKAYLGQGEYVGEIYSCYPRAIPVAGCNNCLPRMELPCTNYFDTLYAEKAGYIRFTVTNTGSSFFNDSLFVKKFYFVRHSENLNIRDRVFFIDNGSVQNISEMGFTGANVNRVIIDTIPAESIRKQYIEWTYKRAADTIIFKRDSIPVSPGAISEYAITY